MITFTGHAFQYTLIDPKLFILRGIVSVFQIEEFTSEKTYTSCIIQQHCTDIIHAADICVDFDFSAVKRNIFLALEFLKQCFLFLFFGTFFLGCFNCCIIRIKYKLPVNPFTTAISSFLTADRNSSPTPIIAGIFMFLARIAVCEFEEPCAVTNASTCPCQA